MQDLSGRAQAALATYLSQGRAALASLLDAQTEEFFAIMSQREAAYQNFCALDALGAEFAVEEQSKQQARRLWQEVDIINRTLFGMMVDAQTQGARSGLRKVPPRAETRPRAPLALRVIRPD